MPDDPTPQPRQKGQPLEDPCHEKFCCARAQGLNRAESYEYAYGDGYTKGSLYTLGWKLLKRVEIRERISEIVAAGTQKVEIEIGDLLEIAVSVLHADPSEATADHPFAELKMSKAGPYYAFPSKATMLDYIAKLKGAYKPTETRTTVSGLDDLLASLSRPGLPQEHEAPAAAPKAPAGLPVEPMVEDDATH